MLTCAVMGGRWKLIMQRGDADKRVSQEEIQNIAAAAGGPVLTYTYAGVGHVSLCDHAGPAWKENVVGYLDSAVLVQLQNR